MGNLCRIGDRMTLPYNFDPLGSTLMVPYKPNIVVWEARPQPEEGGQDNVTATIKLYPGIYEFLLVGGGATLLMVVLVVMLEVLALLGKGELELLKL